jgi:UDP-2,3-diacylglucosamine pyrophosphatase LpxH
MIIAISDLHLGSPLANKRGFRGFIREFLQPNQGDISHLILLGDILDLWRNTNSRVLAENADIIMELGQLEMKKSYIIGNHDYAILNLLSDQGQETSTPIETTGALDHVTDSMELTQDGLNLKFIHGHQIDYWSVLRFYTIFSQAMCFVNIDDQYLYNVWNIVNQFASELPPKTQTKVKNISRQTQVELEQKLAGPLGNMKGEKVGLLYEWNILNSVRELKDVTVPKSAVPEIQNQVDSLSGLLLSEHEGLLPTVERLTHSSEFVNDFSLLWEEMVTWADNNPESLDMSGANTNPLHMSRRIAATLTTGLRSDEYLIRGHGHSPYVSHDSRVADAGCWIETKGSYIKIDEEQVSVHNWKNSVLR